MSRVLAASLSAAVVLALAPVSASTAATAAATGRFAGGLAAAAVVLAILAVWSFGTAGGERARAALQRRNRWDRWTGVGLALSLGAGTLLAAGIGSAPGLFGLPGALWGLLLGVWLVPLLLTSAGFALAFRPPDRAALERLRAACRRRA